MLQFSHFEVMREAFDTPEGHINQKKRCGTAVTVLLSHSVFLCLVVTDKDLSKHSCAELYNIQTQEQELVKITLLLYLVKPNSMTWLLNVHL